MFWNRKSIKETKSKGISAQRRGQLSRLVENIADGTSDVLLRAEILKLRDAVENLPSGSDSRAEKLDRVIADSIDAFNNNKIRYKNVFGGKDAQMLSEQYAKANREIFAKFQPYLSQQISFREALTVKIGDKLFTPKQLKEREQEREKDYNEFAEKGIVDMSILQFSIKKLAIFYEKQILERRNAELVERYNCSESESELEELEQEIASNKKEIRQLDEHSVILTKEISNQRQIRSLLGDMNLDRFINDQQYGQDKLIDIVNEKTKQATKLTQNRRNKNAVLNKMLDSYTKSKNPGYEAGAEGMKVAFGLADDKDIEALRANRERIRAEKAMQSLKSSGSDDIAEGIKDEKR